MTQTGARSVFSPEKCQMVHEDFLKSRLRTSCRAKEQIIFERRKNGGGGGHFDSWLKNELSFKILSGFHVGCEKNAGKRKFCGYAGCNLNLILSNQIHMIELNPTLPE